ncbi:MAG: energy transducer TonB [Acidobacteria bacterium]|nr:energy transducer TonB [Acidobacteriota bacterium]
MRKIVYICFIICFASIFSFAQIKPFEIFDRSVKEQKGGFSGNKEYLSKIFNDERNRLGDNFETELWKYIGADIEKHYWLNSFVEFDSYLHGNKSLPELAFEIRQKGLKLLNKKDDKTSLGRKVTLNRRQAVHYHNIGKRDLAIRSKIVAETILKENDEISAYVGGFTRLSKCIYSNLEGDTSFCEKESQKPIEVIVSSGYVNGIAVELPQPENPQKLKGEIHIKVLIDENGGVISAEAIKGLKELFDVSVKAAKTAKFKPSTLSGKPTKRSGVIVYRFP